MPPKGRDESRLSAECPRNLFSGRSAQDFALARETVRGQPVTATRHRGSSLGPTDPAHTSKRLIAQLNECWRVVDDPLQWILQRKKGNPRKKSTGWAGRSFCRTREALLRCIRQSCGELDHSALEKIKALPDWHLDWDKTNLDVHGTDREQPDATLETLPARALEDSDADE